MSKIVLVGGGSASGKTTITTKAVESIGFDNASIISIDDYYNDLTSLNEEERKRVNYDSPNAFDWRLLKEQILDLKNNKEINKPVYNFKVHNRETFTTTIKPKKIIIIEGIMALVNEKLRDIADVKVFIDAQAEIRFLRRLNRDYTERGRSYESIIKQYLNMVVPAYEEYIYPTIKYADHIIKNNLDESATEKFIKILKDLL